MDNPKFKKGDVVANRVDGAILYYGVVKFKKYVAMLYGQVKYYAYELDVESYNFEGRKRPQWIKEENLTLACCAENRDLAAALEGE